MHHMNAYGKDERWWWRPFGTGVIIATVVTGSGACLYLSFWSMRRAIMTIKSQ